MPTVVWVAPYETMDSSNISNYFMECRNCGHEGRYYETWSKCPHCGCHMSLMVDLNLEQRELLMQSASAGNFSMDTEDDVLLILFKLLGVPLPEGPYAFFAQACWYHIHHMPATEKTKYAMKYYEERFAASVVNVVHDVDEKHRE